MLTPWRRCVPSLRHNQEQTMTDFQIGQTVYGHGEADDGFNHLIVVADVNRLAGDLEFFEFARIEECELAAIIKIRVESDGVEIEGKVPRGMDWYAVKGDDLEWVGSTRDLLDFSDNPTIGRGCITCYGTYNLPAAYKLTDGRLVRLTDRAEIERAKKQFNNPTLVLRQDNEGRA
jgi:hypothetical protein